MINKPCAFALEWWLRGQNKFIGANIRTVGNVITYWSADGVPQPTDEQVNQIVENYIIAGSPLDQGGNNVN